MDWIKIGSALLVVMMLALLWPRARHMLTHSPKGTAKDWKSALIPLLLVIGFVMLLTQLV